MISSHFKILSFLFLSFFLKQAISEPVVTTRPIVGILTQHSPAELMKYGHNYIAASYVKYIESAGARVVPVHHDAPVSVLRNYFEKLNGLLIPGGAVYVDNTTYYQAGKTFYDWSLEAFDQSGDVFPIMGHCLGFELLATATSEDFNILGNVDAENLSLALNFTDNARDSRLFGNAPHRVFDILGNEGVTMNNHELSLLKDTFDSNVKLTSFYHSLSTNYDRNGVEFISSMESIRYPIFAVQWHPEKPLFEWNPAEVINHSQDAVTAMQYMADFTVSQARFSKHSFPKLEEEQHLVIYNYQPVYTYYDFDAFEQAYFFEKWH